MCYFSHFETVRLGENRLIYQDAPEIGDKEPPLPGKRGRANDTLHNLGQLRKGLPSLPPRKPRGEPDAAPPVGPKPPEVQRLLSIDPGDPGPGKNEWDKFPKLRPLLRKMDQAAAQYKRTSLDGAMAITYDSKINSLRRYYVYKAIVENWAEQTLLDIYEKEVHDFYDRIGNKKWFDYATGKFLRAWHSVSDATDLGMKEDNPHLANRQIKVNEKPRIKGELLATAAELKKQIIDCSEWKGNSCKKPRTKDEIKKGTASLGNDTGVIDGEITEYLAELYVNLGIVENQDEQYVTKKFKDKITALYWSCVEKI